VLVSLAGCGLVFDPSPPREAATTLDAGGRDVDPMDAPGGTDAFAPGDGGEPDGAQTDVGLAEAGLAEAGLAEAGLAEAGLAEAGLAEAGLADAGEPDAGMGDAGLDSGAGIDDAGLDASSPDAHVIPLGRVEPLFPWNGFTTGSVRVRDAEPLPNHPLRPKLMWLTVAGASDYEVQLDDDCPLDFRACAFPSPEVHERTGATTFHPAASLPVSTDAPVGRRYCWRVRACAGPACSGWSEVRYLDVGRQPDDFDGDGWADLVAGAPGLDGAAEAAFMRYGSPAGLRGGGADLDNPGGRADFGWSLAAAGDLNGDGYSDLVVGAPFQSSEGKAFVYLGSRTGIRSTPDVTLDNPARQAGGFGFSVAGAGDLNSDGFADLVIGAPTQDAPAMDGGAAFVYFGQGSGVDTTPDLTLVNPVDQAHARFGFAVAGVGDLNGDGDADLVVGAPLEDAPAPDEGNAFVYSGSATGGLGGPVVLDNPEDRVGGWFASSLAGAADMNGDGYADLVVGAPLQSNGAANEGNVFVFPGSPSGVASAPSTVLDSPTDQAFAAFGAALAVGDFDGDGYADLVVGAPLLDAPEVDRGRVFVYLGSRAGIGGMRDAELDNPAGHPRGTFGLALSAGDIDGDGYLDVVVGAPGVSSPERQEGGVLLHLGSPTGVSAGPSETLDSPRGEVEGGFGWSVASAERAAGHAQGGPFCSPG
jgi:hypothetical protein